MKTMIGCCGPDCEKCGAEITQDRSNSAEVQG